MMAHTLGMFAIAPLTGHLVARFGTRRIIFVGACILMISCALAFIGAKPEGTKLLLPALLLLGVGWNFSFVAGSTQVMNGLSFSERLTIQGVGDTITRLAGVSASIVSGLIVGATSYSALGVMGGVASFVPLIALIIWRNRPTEISV
jgi:MFS family permease